jgi:hypothetical protein
MTGSVMLPHRSSNALDVGVGMKSPNMAPFGLGLGRTAALVGGGPGEVTEAIVLPKNAAPAAAAGASSMALMGDWPFLGQSLFMCLPPHVQHVLSVNSLRGSLHGPSCCLLQFGHLRGWRSPP